MAGEKETGSADKTGQDKGDRYIQSRSKLIIETEEAKEHQGAAHADSMHTYFVKDIAEPAAADRQEGAEEEMNGNGGDLRQIFKNDPTPPIKGHAYNIGDHPVLCRPKRD